MFVPQHLAAAPVLPSDQEGKLLFSASCTRLLAFPINARVAVGALAVLTGCNGESPTPPAPVPVAAVAISVAANTLVVGATTQAIATLYDASGNVLTGRPVSWSSSNPGIATVSQTGVVTGASVGGPVDIVATAEGIIGNAQVTVTPPPVATVTVTLAASSIAVGATTLATATLRDVSGTVLTGRLVSWSSSNPAIASVSETGVVTGAAAGGPVSITAKSEGVDGTAFVTVIAGNELLSCLALQPVGEPGCPLISGDYAQRRPSISGSRIVWEDYRSGLPAIFMMDIESQQVLQLTPAGTENILPVIDGDRVVYVRALPCPEPWRLFVYDISARTESLFHEIDCSVGLGRLSLSGNRIAWHERVQDNWDIYVYDFGSAARTRLTTHPADQADPSVHGDLITWSDKRHGGTWWDLYLYDFRTRTERRITQSTTLGRSGIVSDARIVWGDVRGGFFRLYQTSTQGPPQEIPIVTPVLENDLAMSPAGRYVAWVNRNDANPVFYDDVFVHDVLTSTTTRLTRHTARQWYPEVTDDYVAWEDHRSGQARVYILRLSRLPPP